MLNATVNTGLLKKVVKACNAFLNETRVRISGEGIAVRAVDAGKVCFTEILIPKEDFEEFKAENLKAVKSEFVEIEADSKTLKLKAGKACYSIALIDPFLFKQEPRLPFSI